MSILRDPYLDRECEASTVEVVSVGSFNLCGQRSLVW